MINFFPISQITYNSFLYLIYISITVITLLTVTAKNPVHSIFYLISLFFYISFLFLFLKVEFVAIIMLIIYVGALAVLFLFVIMMLNIRILELQANFGSYIPILSIMILVFFFQIYYALKFNFSQSFASYSDNSKMLLNILRGGDSKSQFLFINNKYFFENFLSTHDLEPVYSICKNIFSIKEDSKVHNMIIDAYSEQDFIKSIGILLYTKYFHYVLLSGMILLLAMLGAIVLTLNHKNLIIISSLKRRN